MTITSTKSIRLEGGDRDVEVHRLSNGDYGFYFHLHENEKPLVFRLLPKTFHMMVHAIEYLPNVPEGVCEVQAIIYERDPE